MAALLLRRRRRRRDREAVNASDVDADAAAAAAALAPPLGTVGSQTAESKVKIQLRRLDFWFPLPAQHLGSRVGFFVVFLLPCLDVLRHDAPRQVVVAVVSPWVVEEIAPGGEAVTSEPSATLQDAPHTNNTAER